MRGRDFMQKSSMIRHLSTTFIQITLLSVLIYNFFCLYYLKSICNPHNHNHHHHHHWWRLAGRQSGGAEGRSKGNSKRKKRKKRIEPGAKSWFKPETLPATDQSDLILPRTKLGQAEPMLLLVLSVEEVIDARNHDQGEGYAHHL